VLAKEPGFLALNVFQRIDRDRRMQIDSLDLVVFFRDNYLVVSEADCFMLVNSVDSNNDGLLNYSDFIKIICPQQYTTSINIKSSKKHATYGL
jgi:Ca2+-binding EF-hand superfamily protein